MIFEKVYRFNQNDFNSEGFGPEGTLFVKHISFSERDFHSTYDPFYANRLYANRSVMILIKRCYNDMENKDFGMDGDMDFDVNLELDKFSERRTIYALGSELEGNTDNPLFLIIDDSIPNGQFILKYDPDDDDEDDGDVEVPDEAPKLTLV